MNWKENLVAMAQLAGDASYEQDPDFEAVLPSAIMFAENLILRDLDLLSTRVTDDTGKLTANRRQFILPTDVGTFIVLEVLRPIVNGVYGTPLIPMSRESLDMLFPSEVAPSQPSIPQFWCPVDQATVLVGPAPDDNYAMQCFGTQRPATLDPKNEKGTFISTQLADLFVAAQACFLIGAWEKNWSPQADDPATAVGWQAEYQRRRDPALVEEARKRIASAGWGSRLPNPIASPPQS
jgi:hypothetical protein